MQKIQAIVANPDQYDRILNGGTTRTERRAAAAEERRKERRQRRAAERGTAVKAK